MIPGARRAWGTFVALSIFVASQQVLAQDLLPCTSVGAPAPLQGKCTYFVRAGFVPDDGTADGKTPETAFSSIRDATEKLMDPGANPGEIICVGPGTYVEGDISPGRGGIAGAPIVFFADRAGTLTGDPAGPVRVVRGTSRQAAGFLLVGRKYIVIDGFSISGFVEQGISARFAGPGITVRNVDVQNCGRAGIDIDAVGNVVVENSCSLGNGTTGLSLRGNATSGEPIVPFVSNMSIGLNRTAHGIFIQTSSAGVLQNNLVYGNGATGISLGTAPDTQIIDSVVYENGEAGILIGLGSAGVALRNVEIQDSGKVGIGISTEGLVIVENSSSLRNGGPGLSLEGNEGSGEPIVPFVSNTRIGMNGAHGIFLKTGSAGLLQNNVIYSNRATGISLRAAPDMQVVNNLVYENGEEGLAIGSAALVSPFAMVVGNTFYGNGQWGIELGSGLGSPGATILNNIFLANGDGKGIGVINERGQGLTRIPTTCNYVSGFNVNADGYGPTTPRNVYDILNDPLFVDPPGPDGIVGAELVDGQLVDRSADDNFRLRQDSGASEMSPAVNAGSAPIGTTGLTGSTSDDGRPDVGIVDIGYHYDARSTQVVSIARPFMPIYVRKDGDDRADGKRASTALATISVAGRRARAGVTVVVGPGRYPECDLGPPPDGGLATFIGDSTGERTDDAPGPVLVDARSENCPLGMGVGEDGFLLSNACFATVDGFYIRNAVDDGIKVINQSDHTVIRNNVSFSNRRGINVVNSDDVSLINNLTYANRGGIQTGGTCSQQDCSQAGSRRTRMQNNTCYGNEAVGGTGILIGAGAGVSDSVSVFYNIMQNNGTAEDGNGIQLGTGGSLEGYDAGFNMNADGRYGGVPKPDSDLVADPLFVNPAGRDGILGGDGFEDDNFHLQQIASGQGANSPAVDWGMDRTAEEAGMADRSTRTDNGRDVGFVDLGFHYSGSIVLPGDCNENGEVTIDELVLGLDIALDQTSLAACRAVDRNRDGVVGIDDLIAAIDAALSGGF